MRLALVLLLVNGLVPSLGELAETALHYAGHGHLAHSAADQGDLGDLGREHGCGTTEHHCTCCPSQPMAAVAPAAVRTPGPTRGATAGALGELASLHEPTTPRRPPIAG